MERRQGIQGHCHFTHCILWVDLSNFSGLLVRRWQARWLGRKHILLAFGNRGTLIVSTLGRGEKKTANAPKSHAQELTDTRPTPRLPVFISVLEMGGEATLREQRSRRSTAGCYPREPGLWGFCSFLFSEERLYCPLPRYQPLRPLDLYTPFLRFVSFDLNEQTAARNE